MKCQPTQTPDAIDVPALREKYRQERDRRLRSEGQHQYRPLAAEVGDPYEADPYVAVAPRSAISEDLEVAILGAGWSGIMAAYRLKQAGVTSFRNIDPAGDFGGCWYWNRFPGLQCDNDAYCYVLLLEETGYMPTKKYVDGFEIYDQFRRIANQFDLYDNALFHTAVRALRWDEEILRWRLTTNRGDDIRARFVVMACGPLNKPKLPGIPGIQSFKGRSFHTARWDYAYTGGHHRDPTLDKLADKRVALVGTGATAVQVVPYLGRYAKQLYVLQRTPSSVDRRVNPPTDPAWVKTLKPGWQKERQSNFHDGATRGFAPEETDLICDFWTEVARNLSAKLDAMGRPSLTREELAELREREDYAVMERLRRRIEGIVTDKETAEALKPYYRFMCKRPCSSEDYYETFNRENVELIDVSPTRGVERLTENGFVAHGVEYPVDCIVFASGFEVTSDPRERWGMDVIEGRDGLSLYDHWRDGHRTLHGVTTHGFPNLFFIHFSQSGVHSSIPAGFDQQAHHIAYIITRALERGATTVHCSQKAQDEWVRTIRATAIDNTQFLRECTPSYYNNEGAEKLRYFLGEPYGKGFYAFEKLLRQWRDGGDMEGLLVQP
jgi:cyclohexanone monooxygenase